MAYTDKRPTHFDKMLDAAVSKYHFAEPARVRMWLRAMVPVNVHGEIQPNRVNPEKLDRMLISMCEARGIEYTVRDAPAKQDIYREGHTMTPVEAQMAAERVRINAGIPAPGDPGYDQWMAEGAERTRKAKCLT